MEYGVFVKLDDRGRVIDINSDMFIGNTSGWIEIGRGKGDRFQHAQGNFLEKPVFNSLGIPIYKIVNGKLVERTKEEIAADVLPVADSRIVQRIQALESVVDSIKRIIDRLSPL